MTKLTLSGYEKIMSDAADKMSELYDTIKRKDAENSALRARVELLEEALDDAIAEIKFQFAEKQKLTSDYYYAPLWDEVAKHNKVVIKCRAVLENK